MDKVIHEEIKLTVDNNNQVLELIEALINNYDIYIKQVKVKDNKYSCMELNKYEVKLHERAKDE